MKTIKDYLVNEDKTDDKAYGEIKKRFLKFTEELEKLSKKYGICIMSIGGVTIYEEGVIQSVLYSTDASSGDLTYIVKEK